MSRGHNFTRCQYCGKEYVCGDCITTNCELRHDKRKCPDYQNHIRQLEASASVLGKAFNDSDKKKAGISRLLAGLNYDQICAEMTDKELAEQLKLTVWAKMSIGTREIALMEQAIDRLAGTLPAVKG